MTSKEFTIWLKGFITACNEYSPTPKQWDIIKEELEKVSDEKPIGTPIGEGGWGTPNHDLVDRYPWGGQKVWGGTAGTPINCLTTTGSFSTQGFVVTTTPGYGSISYNPSTTTTAYPSGSVWHYTNNNQPFTTQDDNSLKPTHKKRKKKTVEDWEEEIDLGGHE